MAAFGCCWGAQFGGGVERHRQTLAPGRRAGSYWRAEPRLARATDIGRRWERYWDAKPRRCRARSEQVPGPPRWARRSLRGFEQCGGTRASSSVISLRFAQRYADRLRYIPVPAAEPFGQEIAVARPSATRTADGGVRAILHRGRSTAYPPAVLRPSRSSLRCDVNLIER